jgi:PPOX class probable F420-dependent enzyme
MTVCIPNSHQGLLLGKAYGVLTTMMPDDMPQSSIIWVDYDGEYVLINSTLERQKGRNMQANPRVTLLVIDPLDSSRWIEIRGRVKEITQKGAEAHADKLAHRYNPAKHHFYGEIYPIDQRLKETRVMFKIEPIKVSMDAIFK